jgi:protein gp37
MEANFAIPWTEAQWDPLVGCTRKSAACRHCYAESWTALHSQPGEWGHGFAERGPGGAAWTGTVGLIEERLTFPLGLQQKSRILVNALSDLFHESLPTETIDRVFAIMAKAPQHIFLILTKRPKTAKPYLSDAGTPDRIAHLLTEDSGSGSAASLPWPLPNVWLGVTAENQKEAERRIPLLLETPAALRFAAAEPLLERIDLESPAFLAKGAGDKPRLDWIIAGGETGEGANACHPDWARALRDQCERTATPFFWTGWGGHLPPDQAGSAIDLPASGRIDGVLHAAIPSHEAPA